MSAERTRDPEKHIKDLGKRLNELDETAAKALNFVYEKERYTKAPDVIISYAHEAYRTASEVAINEINEARSVIRSYGLEDRRIERWLNPPSPTEFAISDYYYHYLMELAGVIHEETLSQANVTLAKAEKAGKGVNEAALDLKEVLKNLALNRLKTIVRTEGTRVASAARRDIALKAAEGGLGPHWLIYTSIMDDRTTHTCQVAHNHKRPVDPSSPLWLEIPPPAHYNCRSMERYGFRWFENDVATPDWDEMALREFRSVRQAEFPKWIPRQLPERDKEPLFKANYS